MVVATAIAGVGGYVITTVVARGLGDERYATFAIFWAALYLVIGALSGVQQEVSRATRPIAPADGARPVVLATILAGVVLALIGSTVPLWGHAVFSGNTALAWPVAIGAGCYIFVAAFSGGMYGLSLWRPLAAVIVLDVALRLTAVSLGLAAGVDTLSLAWLTVVPFPLVAVLAIAATLGRVVSAPLDVGYGKSLLNVARTVAAGTATAVLVSGFPLLIGLAGADTDARALSSLIFALILTRAPLVVATLALQSYLVVHFRDRVDIARRLLVYIAMLVAAAIVLALLLLIAGEAALLALTNWDDVGLDGGMLALLLLSSLPTAILAMVGSAVLSRSKHTQYSTGWMLSAAASIAILFLPGDLFVRVLLALSLGPLFGILVYNISLRCR